MLFLPGTISAVLRHHCRVDNQNICQSLHTSILYVFSLCSQAPVTIATDSAHCWAPLLPGAGLLGFASMWGLLHLFRSAPPPPAVPPAASDVMRPDGCSTRMSFHGAPCVPSRCVKTPFQYYRILWHVPYLYNKTDQIVL